MLFFTIWDGRDYDPLLKMKVRPWIAKDKDHFGTFDKIFDCPAALKSKPEEKKPGGQQ
jgi:hypothetical protein